MNPFAQEVRVCLCGSAANFKRSLEELFRFPGQETLSVCGEEVVALIISALKSKDEEMIRKIKIFLTEILGCSL